MAEDDLGELIVDSVDLRSKYESVRPKYERLMNLVTLILKTAVLKKNIKLHSMKQRVKDYNSFLEKVERKRYKDPFRQCTDLAGCRLVCLFTSQIDEIKKIIEQEFDVIEITNKKSTKKYDQFGYLSLHMLVKVPKHRLKHIEYSDLKDLVCEIQIRTILQEAWAEIEHYLNYKATKEERNEELLRKIFSLAGMFEVADATFEDIHKGFSEMVETKSVIKDGDITAVALYNFSKKYFKWFDEEWDKSQERKFFRLSSELKKLGIKSIDSLKVLLDKQSKSIEYFKNAYRDKKKFSPAALIRASLALEYGTKYDLVFGLKGFSNKIKKDVLRNSK